MLEKRQLRASDVYMVSVLVAEDEIVLVPRRTRRLALAVLPDLVGPQGGDGAFRKDK
jgi:hypothetical protein